MGKKIGVFGGSFDPIHYGHLLVAEQCREHAQLDSIIFIPASQSPLKSLPPVADAKQRLEMIQLATAGHETFEVNRIELDRQGPSFTIETLRTLAQQFSADQLFLIVGSDALKDFSRWREPNEILELALPLIVARPGEPTTLESLRIHVSPQRWEQMQNGTVRSPLCEISSSDMRRRVTEGRSIRYMTPRSVEMYISACRLYLRDPS